MCFYDIQSLPKEPLQGLSWLVLGLKIVFSSGIVNLVIPGMFEALAYLLQDVARKG
jgi:hypothetical protein